MAKSHGLYPGGCGEGGLKEGHRICNVAAGTSSQNNLHLSKRLNSQRGCPYPSLKPMVKIHRCFQWWWWGKKQMAPPSLSKTDRASKRQQLCKAVAMQFVNTLQQLAKGGGTLPSPAQEQSKWWGKSKKQWRAARKGREGIRFKFQTLLSLFSFAENPPNNVKFYLGLSIRLPNQCDPA